MNFFYNKIIDIMAKWIIYITMFSVCILEMERKI